MNSRTKRRRLAGISATSGVALLLGGIAPLLAASPAFATSFIPYQFISKLYTEGLGRSADQGGWTNYANVFASGGCSLSTLDTVANSILLSPEFNGIGYSNPALVEVAYRALLNREPDPTGYATWNGDSMSTIVSGIEASSEFSSLASTICSTPDYRYGSNAPLALSPTGPGYSGSEAGLQSLLNAATSGSTVTLQERALVPLTTTLVIPPGVTLTTYGSPSTNTYAEMGRLARQPGWSGNSVDVDGGAHVTHTWIDGDRLRESSYDRLRFNLEILPGSGTSLTYDRIGNTAGATNMQVDGATSTTSCSSTVIAYNLIDSYSANHDGVSESDGISDGCGTATIDNNAVIDASDVAIILFGSPSYTQASQVDDNVIIQSGHGAHALLALDGSTSTYPSVDPAVSFAGASIHDNSLWSSPAAVSTFGISAGTFALFGPATPGTGGSITNNSAGSLGVTAESGIGVSGQLSTTVTGNSLNWTAGSDPTSHCPQYAVGASVSAGYASGTIQTYTDVTYSSCWDH